jgi:hypothetical protein
MERETTPWGAIGQEHVTVLELEPHPFRKSTNGAAARMKARDLQVIIPPEVETPSQFRRKTTLCAEGR